MLVLDLTLPLPGAVSPTIPKVLRNNTWRYLAFLAIPQLDIPFAQMRGRVIFSSIVEAGGPCLFLFSHGPLTWARFEASPVYIRNLSFPSVMWTDCHHEPNLLSIVLLVFDYLRPSSISSILRNCSQKVEDLSTLES